MIHQASHCLIIIVLMLTIVVCDSCATNGQQKVTRGLATSPAEVDDFVARVSSSSPEVSADLLIRIAQSKLISDKKESSPCLRKPTTAAPMHRRNSE